MKDSNWGKVQKIVDLVLELPQKEHNDFIEKHCADNEELKAEVKLYLDSIYSSEGWFEGKDSNKNQLLNEMVEDIETLSFDHSLIGKEVGSYTIKKQVGKAVWATFS